MGIFFSKPVSVSILSRFDPCYGKVELFPIALQLLETPEFQRLMHLKQLGLIPYTKDSLGRSLGQHYRLEHSVGVAHLAHMIGVHFVNKGWITHHDVLILVLAGICHDLGHIMFCHKGDDVLKQLAPQTAEPHEYRSQYMAMDVLRKYTNLSEDDIFMVAHIIEPKHHLPGSTVDYDQPRTIRLANIINNVHHGLDVDKMDYVCFRDPHHLDISQQPIVSFACLMKIFKRSYIDADNVWRFAQADQSFCQQLKERRSLLYKEHYLSPRVAVLDAMVVDIMKTLQALHVIDLRMVRSDDISTWLYMTDEWWLQLIELVEQLSQVNTSFQPLLLLMQAVFEDNGFRYFIETSSTYGCKSNPPPPCCIMLNPSNTSDEPRYIRRVAYGKWECLDPRCAWQHYIPPQTTV